MRIEGLGDFEVVGYERAKPMAAYIGRRGVFWEGTRGGYVGTAGKGPSVMITVRLSR